MEYSWAKAFAEDIFPAIDEEPFSVLYSSNASRPNTPINICIGALIIKEIFGISDDEFVMYNKSVSKIDIVQNIAKELPVPPVMSYFLCDCWYVSEKIINTFATKGFHTIGALKTNRMLYPFGIKKKLSEFATLLSIICSDFHLVTVKNQKYYVYQYKGKLNGIENAVVLLSYHEKAFGNPKALRAFLSTDISLSMDEILAYYICRWPIEVFFRQCKTKLALDNYQIRSSQGIQRYWLLMSLAHYMCVAGTGELYRYLFQCAKECHDFDSFVKSVA